MLKALKGYFFSYFLSHGIDGMEKLSYVCPMELIFLHHLSSHIHFFFLFAPRKKDWGKEKDFKKKGGGEKKTEQ